MNALFSVDGILYKAMTKLYQLMVLNILWFVFSLPLFTVGASTTALLYVSGKILRNEETAEIKDFYASFIENFRHATLIWLMICAVSAAAYLNIRIFEGNAFVGSLMSLLYVLILSQLLIVTLVVFLLLSRYELTVTKALKISWIIGNKHILSVAAVLVLDIISIIMTLLLPALFIFVFASAAAFGNYLILSKVIEKYSPRIS